VRHVNRQEKTAKELYALAAIAAPALLQSRTAHYRRMQITMEILT
jgi:hypothetical protein